MLLVILPVCLAKIITAEQNCKQLTCCSWQLFAVYPQVFAFRRFAPSARLRQALHLKNFALPGRSFFIFQCLAAEQCGRHQRAIGVTFQCFPENLFLASHFPANPGHFHCVGHNSYNIAATNFYLSTNGHDLWING